VGAVFAQNIDPSAVGEPVGIVDEFGISGAVTKAQEAAENISDGAIKTRAAIAFNKNKCTFLR